MNNFMTYAVLGAASLTLAACGGKLGEAERMEAAGSTFDKALYADYISLSKSEYGEGDYTDSDRFAEKAAMAAVGETPAPYDPAKWQIPSDRQAVMNGAHQRLVAALAGTAKDKATTDLARAQTSFDCWVQEQEENFQPDDIAACRDAFIAAMDAVEKKTMVAAPAPKPAPAVMDAKTWEVFFKFDSTEMLPGSSERLQAAVAYVNNFQRPRITIAGHTDTSGPSDYNQALSERRAEAVAISAMDMGMDPKNVIMRSFGEQKLSVPTEDNVREQKNRRATITVESK
ncbi:OmpA family protein [Sneathiella chinensis]|uniref:Membrane protein n=1 Tax=Sneathiella chinensis TaxID=349750 RepID=A0ABQ5U7C7_9PROT|nr:OmpA family protein [Sneathiella chinensis]GLQ08017.1 membrane protein [Sneathiella chinensis]